MPITSPDIRTIGTGETRTIRVGLQNALETSVTLTLSSITEVTTSDLTLANKAVNTATFNVVEHGVITTVAIGQGVEFSCSGGTAGKQYKVRIVATTSDAVAQTIEYDQQIEFF